MPAASSACRIAFIVLDLGSTIPCSRRRLNSEKRSLGPPIVGASIRERRGPDEPREALASREVAGV
jgi:hypothetical protein